MLRLLLIAVLLGTISPLSFGGDKLSCASVYIEEKRKAAESSIFFGFVEKEKVEMFKKRLPLLRVTFVDGFSTCTTKEKGEDSPKGLVLLTLPRTDQARLALKEYNEKYGGH